MESHEQFTLWLALTTGGLALLVAAATGFICGIWLGPWWQRRQFSRALKDAALWQNRLLTELEQVEKNCTFALSESQKPFPPDRQNRLEKVQSRLIESLQRLANLRGNHSSPPAVFQFEWINDAHSASSGLPDRSTFDLNLKHMLDYGTSCHTTSALLLVRMDRHDSALRRYGSSETHQLLQKMIALVIRSARDTDLICQFDEQTISVLLPNLTPAQAWRQAEMIRDSIRTHHFLLENGQQEVIVTASSGLSCSQPQNNPEELIQSARRALAKAESLGRNRLIAE